MLGMDVNQLKCQVFKQSQRNRRIVYEGPAFAVGIDFPTHQATVRAVLQIVLFKKIGQVTAADIKFSLNKATGLAFLNGFNIGSLTQNQGQGSQEN